MSRQELLLRRWLARNVRRRREALKLTLAAAAERAGMDWRHWQKVEAGEVNVTLRTLARLAEALGLEEATLLEKDLRPYLTDPPRGADRSPGLPRNIPRG